MPLTISRLQSALKPDFGDFLYASIGEEKNGMLLSVLSALARQGVDPWEEAAHLAAMPAEAAIQKMACAIEAVPQGSWGLRPNPHSTATRLIALLPKPSVASRTSPRAEERGRHAPAAHHHLLFVAIIVITLCSEWLTARIRPAAPPDTSRGPASSVAVPASSPNSGN